MEVIIELYFISIVFIILFFCIYPEDGGGKEMKSYNLDAGSGTHTIKVTIQMFESPEEMNDIIVAIEIVEFQEDSEE